MYLEIMHDIVRVLNIISDVSFPMTLWIVNINYFFALVRKPVLDEGIGHVLYKYGRE